MASPFKKNQTKLVGRKSQTLISSPLVKRVPSRPVTLQGWLLKRGSDGLMRWKKRWFVLSDFCLFYYKDTQEEKLLGSLILASYKISQCSPDEKGYKKFSFKAEHTNMRTYYFAAENQLIMDQWIKAMSLASLLEENISLENLSSEYSKNQNNQFRESEGLMTPTQETGGGLRTPDPQPVYANAPPKPKRLNDSSSPETSLDLTGRDDSFQNYQAYHNIYNNVNSIHSFKPTSRHGFAQYDRNTDIYGRTGPMPMVKKQNNTAGFKATKDNIQNAKNVSFNFPPRPRSVDFLECSGKNSETSGDSGERGRLCQRPKSSLCTVSPADEAPWSAEEYARRMRQSSLYVKPTARRSLSSNPPGTVAGTKEPLTSSEKIPGVFYRTKDTNIHNDDAKFSRSASARLCRPLSDCHEQPGFQNATGNFVEAHLLASKDAASKVHKQEEAMKRLLEWKNRMTNSSLRKARLSRTPERHSSYIADSPSQPSPPPAPQQHPLATKKQTKTPEKVLNHHSNQVANDKCRNVNVSSPTGTFYQFSSDDDGLAGPESKYGTSGSIVEKCMTERDRRKVTVEEMISSGNPSERIPGRTQLENSLPLNQIIGPIDLSKDQKINQFESHSPIRNDLVLPSKSLLDYDHKNNSKNSFPNSQDPSTKMESPREKDEEWGAKIDESRVIKEFSYHYITSGKYEDCSNRNQDFVDVEALQPRTDKKRPESRNEFLKNPDFKKETHLFQKLAGKCQKKSNKGIIIANSSVRTYRRDFPPKPLPSDVLNKNVLNNPDVRLVQSDSEALLYDTSSDMDDKIIFHKNHLEKPESSSDEERDEEVAAVLSKSSVISSPVFDSAKSPYRKCNSADNLDLVTPTNYPPHDLKRASDVSQLSPYQIVHEKNLSTSTDVNSDVQEENYMPMTPRKKSDTSTKTVIIHSRSNSASHSSIMDNLFGSTEESPYVEMTQNGPINKSFKNVPERKNEPLYGPHADSERYCEVGRIKEMQYEMIYQPNSHPEPLYMEVPSGNGKERIPLLPRSDTVLELNNSSKDNLNPLKMTTLPDILNSTAPPLNPGSGRSDSSDADDEASKDLDSLDAPRHPRFSLSDTFRPASYYLGASLGDRPIIAMNTEHNDSSDSDLVSPPPIPASSPPLDEFETSLDSTIVNRDTDSNIYSNESFKNTNIKNLIPSFKKKRNSNSNLYEASSEESVNLDKRDQRLKRRPLSADILSSLQDINFVIPSSDSDLKSQAFDNNLPVESRHMSGMKQHKQKSKRNDYYSTREDVSIDNDSENDLIGTGQNHINNPRLLTNETLTIQNQYENLPLSRSDYNYYIDKYINKKNTNIYKEKLPYIKENNSLTSSEHQNAPYYYSDLLKIDTKNLQKLDKSHWKEHNLIDDEKESLQDENIERNSNTESAESPRIHSGAMRRDVVSSSLKLKRGHNYSNNENRNTNFNRSFSEIQTPHRTRSLEGLIDNTPKSRCSLRENVKLNAAQPQKKSEKVILSRKSSCQAEDEIWEEDAVWRESLRKVSLRQTRSLEDLDRKETTSSLKPSGETKMYENLRITQNHKSVKQSEGNPSSKDKKPFHPKRTKDPDGNNSSFEIDREKLRQWDLMSSAPATLSSNRALIKPISERKSNFPPIVTGGGGGGGEPTGGDGGGEPSEPEVAVPRTKEPPPSPAGATVTPPPLLEPSDQNQTWNLKVSAGELLGRTHEELVLLLIQLRRQRAAVCQSMEKCHREIETKACLADLDKANRIEHLKKLDELKAKLADLEKQYEKGKPLVNLVDNMVKLGSLYQAGSPQKIEFIQRIQEQRLLAEERRDWERIRPDHQELKAKVERLYRLDKLLQEESGTLHSLQQDKGALERALGGVRTKLQGIHGNSPETEWYRRQQRLLERELSRVRSILALNSKKLEETVAENARLEQELVVLRQKLQLSRRSGSGEAGGGGREGASLEAELCRVQLLVGDLLRQRQELSQQVSQLTERSNSLSRQIGPPPPPPPPPPPLSGECATPGGKKPLSNGWIETDLDLELSREVSSPGSLGCSQWTQPVYSSPLYVNTAHRESLNDVQNFGDDLYEGSPLSGPDCSRVSENYEEDFFRQSYGLHLKEKPQEIKTVRIVKRESERRQRDRDRSGNIGIPITTFTNPKRPSTDDRFSDKTRSEKDSEDIDETVSEPPPTPAPRTDSMNAVWNMVRKNKLKGRLVRREGGKRVDGGDVETAASPQLSPVYLSEAARRIVEEVAWSGLESPKRLIPKEKRRHHTMSGPALAPPSAQPFFSQMGSRDDLDIERVLRPRLTTPDVVRSTLIRVDPHYTKETIDNILGAPGKIVIPERYIPESQPQLSQEEQNKRSKKADAIRRMLCETSAAVPSKEACSEKTSSLKRIVAEEKKNREHLLQLSQILAQQVMEKSKIVAVMAIASLPPNREEEDNSEDDEPYSSFEDLPLYQQRDNYFS